MEQVVAQFTEGFIEKLPDDFQFYTLQELTASGIPPFIVQFLKEQVWNLIEEDLEQPESEWVDSEIPVISSAWLEYVKATKQSVRIPSGKLRELLSYSINQSLVFILKPRQAVPEYLFDKKDEIDIETARERILTLPANRVLGTALVKYMERRKLSTLSLKRAKEIIEKVDQKIVADYHPLNWAQLLKPLFQLGGSTVDSDLMRIFFEDKGKHRIAKKFDLLDKEIDETEFIEILSSAELLDFEGYEDDQQQLFGGDEGQKSESGIAAEEKEPESVPKDELEVPWDETTEDTVEELYEENPANAADEEIEDQEADRKIETITGEEEIPDEPELEESEDDEERIVDLFSTLKAEDELESVDLEENSGLTLVEKEDEPEDEEKEIPLLNRFIFDDTITEEDEDVTTTDTERTGDEPTSIYDELNLVREPDSEKEFVGEESEETKPETETELETEEVEAIPEVEGVSEPELEAELEPELESKEPADEEAEEEEALSFHIESKDEEIVDDEKSKVDETTSIQEEVEDAPADEDEDELPMWKSFLERDDIEAESGFEYDEDETETEPEPDLNDELEEETDEDGFIEEPIYDLTAEEPAPEEKISKIATWLSDERDRFVEEIFMGSDMAYEEALLEIVDYDDWKSASRYLEKEVFTRNRIDVYDEVAVDFTDRLHSYFMEYKS